MKRKRHFVSSPASCAKLQYKCAVSVVQQLCLDYTTDSVEAALLRMHAALETATECHGERVGGGGHECKAAAVSAAPSPAIAPATAGSAQCGGDDGVCCSGDEHVILERILAASGDGVDERVARLAACRWQDGTTLARGRSADARRCLDNPAALATLVSCLPHVPPMLRFASIMQRRGASGELEELHDASHASDYGSFPAHPDLAILPERRMWSDMMWHLARFVRACCSIVRLVGLTWSASAHVVAQRHASGLDGNPATPCGGAVAATMAEGSYLQPRVPRADALSPEQAQGFAREWARVMRARGLGYPDPDPDLGDAIPFAPVAVSLLLRTAVTESVGPTPPPVAPAPASEQDRVRSRVNALRCGRAASGHAGRDSMLAWRALASRRQ